MRRQKSQTEIQKRRLSRESDRKMEDFQIVDLYWQRNEVAITETDRKYGAMLMGVSFSLLSSREDAEECVNDTYLAAWNRMPTDRPAFLGTFLTRIVRNISVSRYRKLHSEKRGGEGNIIEELTECIPDGNTLDAEFDSAAVKNVLNRFLMMQNEEKRAVFVRRYFWSQDIASIASQTGLTEGKIKSILFRMREALRGILEKEGLL